MRVNKLLTIFVSSLLLICTHAIATIETTQPYLGAIQKSFTELAKTRLNRTYTINMPISGQLNRINLEPGDKVSKNQMLAQLNKAPLINAVKAAEQSMLTFKEWYDLRVKILARQEKLYKKGFTTQEQLDQARAYVQMLAAQTSKDKADLATAKYNLNRSTIYSPITGTVLNRYQQGDTWLPEGTQLLELGDLNNLEVICDVLTQDAQMLQIGDPVLLTSIGNPIVLQGKVKRIDPAGFTKKSSLGVDEQRVNVIISLQDSNKANLGVGYRLQAKFLVGSKQKNAVIVPRFSVLQDTNGNYYVFKVKDKKIYKEIVSIGIKTDTEISITKGITTKDIIVAQPTADMHDGMKV